MGHVEELSERILFLKEDSDMVAASNVEKITESVAMLSRTMAMEDGSARDYNLWALECGKNADPRQSSYSRKLIHDEEGHFDAFEKQTENIQRFGPNYLALQAFEVSAACH
jgi:bacterioferritin